MTTPTGIPITLCTDCNREHPVTRQHEDALMTCPVCGNPMPRTALSTCSWPCALVARHIFTRTHQAHIPPSTGAVMSMYRKRPVVIEARQFCGTTSQTHAIYQWVENNTLGSFEPMAVIEGREPWPESGVTIDPRDGRMIIATLEGGHWVNLFDYVIRGVQGEFYPCKPDIFAATYEPEIRAAVGASTGGKA